MIGAHLYLQSAYPNFELMIFFNKIDLAFEITRLHRLSSGSQDLRVVLVVYQQSKALREIGKISQAPRSYTTKKGNESSTLIFFRTAF